MSKRAEKCLKVQKSVKKGGFHSIRIGQEIQCLPHANMSSSPTGCCAALHRSGLEVYNATCVTFNFETGNWDLCASRPDAT